MSRPKWNLEVELNLRQGEVLTEVLGQTTMVRHQGWESYAVDDNSPLRKAIAEEQEGKGANEFLFPRSRREMRRPTTLR